jgi:hypothetical protein
MKLDVQLIPPQFAVQSTPEFDGSPATVAAIFRLPPAGKVAGGGCVMETPEIVEVIVTDEEPDLLRLVEDKAVTFTEFPEGTSKGAVNVELAPLAVCVGLNVPQFGALPHIATQSTPAFAGSLLTLAETVAVPPTGMVEGGVCVKAREISGVCEALALLPLEQPEIPDTTK